MPAPISTRSEIEALLPHTNGMVLLDEISAWQQDRIECKCTSHLNSQNPLRVNGKLASLAGIEYAAQAMAAHAKLQALESSGAPKRGFVAVASKIDCQQELLDKESGSIQVMVTMLDSTEDSTLAEFQISNALGSIVSGRLLAVLESLPS